MKAVQARAPGRVNLIGEHTDYNDGFVLPCAIAYDTRVRGSSRTDRAVCVRSSEGEPAAFDLESLPGDRSGTWSDYARGVLTELRDAGVGLCGADLSVTGTVPLGAGLSSSASLEVALALAMLALSDARMPPLDLARLTQRAEIAYVGTRCGIMDQFTAIFARAGHALFLDTRSLDFDLIPVPADAAIVICNTMVKHDLATGAYNDRRSECERGAALLRDRDPSIRALRDVRIERFADAAALLAPTLRARVRHVVSENARVVAAAAALRQRDLARFGALMYESHESLRTDYEVSCPELDTMVALAKTFDGTIGARMTGGGFGGCTVNLVRADRARDFREYVSAGYHRETGIVPEFYDGTPSEGATVLDE